MNKLRTVCLIKDNTEIQIHWNQLKKGNYFKLYEFNGDPVVWDGCTIFLAFENAKKNNNGLFQVKCDKVY